MMGERWNGEETMFYEFSLERHVPAEHLLRSIDRFVELDGGGASWCRFAASLDGLRSVRS
jgi:hypothetical protein